MQWQWILVIVLGAITLAILAGLLGRALVRRGMRRPWAIRVINRISERVMNQVKKPLTIAVLDEVAQVLQAGHYTETLATALHENELQLKDMIAEKIAADPAMKHLRLVPFGEQIVAQSTDATMRIFLQMLADPRTDAMVAGLLRANLAQLRAAVLADEPGIWPFSGAHATRAGLPTPPVSTARPR